LDKEHAARQVTEERSPQVRREEEEQVRYSCVAHCKNECVEIKNSPHISG